MQVVPAARAVNVERLAHGIKPRHAAALHRFAVKLGDVRAAARHLRVLRVARTEDRKTVIFDNAGKLRISRRFWRGALPPRRAAGGKYR